MNQKPGEESLGREANVTSSVDYAALQAEALEQNHETFTQRAMRAEQESDPEFASDLRFAAQVSTALKEDGKRALVVGGYARDEAISRETGVPQISLNYVDQRTHTACGILATGSSINFRKANCIY